MKLFTITSEYSKSPLAEIRTDGRRLEFIVDNTAGMLPKLAQNSFLRLQAVVEQSSHLEMHEPKVATVSLLRYILDNGDVVEVTADGKTALVNGRLLNDQEEKALFDAIRRKELRVARKTDMAGAIPVLPSMHQMPEAPKTQKDMSSKDIEPGKAIIAKANKAKAMGTSYGDDTIDNIDFKSSYNFNPETSTRLLYLLKYGITKGEDPNGR